MASWIRVTIVTAALVNVGQAEEADLKSAGCSEYQIQVFQKATTQAAAKKCIDTLKAKVDELQKAGGVRESGTLLSALEAKLKAVGFQPASSGDGSVPRVGEPVSRYLFRLHRIYQEIAKDKTVRDSLKGEIAPVKLSLHRIMNELNLREPFAAALDTGLTITDSGNTAIPYARDSNDKAAFGAIDWESKHFNEHGLTDWSFGGRMGVVPTLMLVHRSDKAIKDATGKITGPGTIHPLFQSAFHWDINGRFSVHASDSGEASFVARAGQAQVLNESESVGTQANPVSTSLIANDLGRSAWFWEVGPEFRLFDNPIENVHEDKTYHSPVFSVAAGYRKNNRFRQAGPIKDFVSPQDRWFFRFGISLNKIVDRRATDSDPKTFALGFAVEYEGPWKRGDYTKTVPSATRIVLTANFDALSKLQRAGSAK